MTKAELFAKYQAAGGTKAITSFNSKAALEAAITELKPRAEKGGRRNLNPQPVIDKAVEFARTALEAEIRYDRNDRCWVIAKGGDCITMKSREIQPLFRDKTALTKVIEERLAA